MDRTRTIYGLGGIGLGVLSLLSADFAFQWQPVPKDIPFHAALAYLSGALLMAGGVACLWRRSSAWGALGLGLMFAVWVVALHMPNALADGAKVASWNAVAEAWALSLGGLASWATEKRPDLAAPARRLFGIAPVIFGLAHFGYAGFTASMVPAWIPPGQLFWAYLTGAGQLSAGLSLISGVLSRLAATLLAAMYAVFVLALHAPRVAAAPTNRFEWTMLCIALTLTGAAWMIRDSARKAP
jgi:uncharacterized membrane protein YphA (DoxX/SURF4 family)